MKKTIKKILVSDDVSARRLTIKNFIELIDTDLEVIEASDGEKALNIIGDSRPELVVTNLVLPIVNCYALISHIHHIHHRNIFGKTINYAPSLIVFQLKEIMEVDDFWLRRGVDGIEIYGYVSIQDGFSNLEECIKRYFDGLSFPLTKYR